MSQTWRSPSDLSTIFLNNFAQMAFKLSLQSLSAKELQNEHRLLEPLLNMINEAYSERDQEGSVSRYPTSEAIWKDLGDEGRCVIIRDPENGNIPVAIAGAKPWKTRGIEANGRVSVRDWEITPVASRTDPRYRKKGLVDRCLGVLYSDLLDNAEQQELTVWVKVVEKFFGDYWKKKGFVQVGTKWVIPRGEWHRDHEFILIDMCKKVPGSGRE